VPECCVLLQEYLFIYTSKAVTVLCLSCMMRLWDDFLDSITTSSVAEFFGVACLAAACCWVYFDVLDALDNKPGNQSQPPEDSCTSDSMSQDEPTT